MEKITIIRDTQVLEGTCYFEISKGKYDGKHWQNTSLFFEEEIFGLIEYVFEKHCSKYSHYSMNDVSKSDWTKIREELITLNQTLNNSNDFSEVLGKVGFIFSGTRDYFQNHFETCKADLISMNKELIDWVDQTFSHHSYISVLGI